MAVQTIAVLVFIESQLTFFRIAHVTLSMLLSATSEEMLAKTEPCNGIQLHPNLTTCFFFLSQNDNDILGKNPTWAEAGTDIKSSSMMGKNVFFFL